ncbi:MAG TPA: acyl-CoA dehydrogenase family protein, partial [Acidimicrobiia bacterium]|nr:acyl-CoA dehydrogenase family protein [Acidimicrobiia bacterium]
MADLDEFRTRVREFLATHAEPAGAAAVGAGHHDDGDTAVARGKAFQGALADAGLAALTYPTDAGGAGLDAEH